MTLDEYQTEAKKFARYPCGLTYACLALAGECGELCNAHKKELRDKENHRDHMIDELGDVLWYVSAVANELGVRLDTIAKLNLDKLERRRDV